MGIEEIKLKTPSKTDKAFVTPEMESLMGGGSHIKYESCFLFLFVLIKMSNIYSIPVTRVYRSS